MKYIKLFMAATVCGIYLSFMYINPVGGRITLSEMTLQLSGSRGDFALGFSLPELMSFIMCLFPSFLFEIYAGILLYRHFCTASIYVFSRYPRRVKWYLREIGCLSGAVCTFQMILLVVTVIITIARWDLQIDTAGIELLIYHFLIQSLWIYIMALSVNLLAVYLGSSIAYAAVICIQLTCVVLFYVADTAVKHLEGVSYKKLLIWNPLAHLVVAWHSSREEAVARILKPESMGAGMNYSLMLFVIIGVVITSAGAVIIKNHELLVSDSEGAV